MSAVPRPGTGPLSRFSLAGKSILITGATGALGRAAATALSQAGAALTEKIGRLDHKIEKLQVFLARLPEPFALRLAKAVEVDRLARGRLARDHGRLAFARRFSGRWCASSTR